MSSLSVPWSRTKIFRFPRFASQPRHVTPWIALRPGLPSVTNTDRRHRRLACCFELRMFGDQRMKVFRLAHIIVNPLADLVCSVTFEAHPHLQPAKTSRLLEAVNVILVSFIRTI